MRKARQKQIFLVVEIKRGRFLATACGEDGAPLLEYERAENISVEPESDIRAFVLECQTALEKPNTQIRLGVVAKDAKSAECIKCDRAEDENALIRAELSRISGNGTALLLEIGEVTRTVLAIGASCTEGACAQDAGVEEIAEHIFSLCSLVHVDAVIIEAVGKYANDGVAVSKLLKNKLGTLTRIHMLERTSLAASAMMRKLSDQKY